MLVKEIDGVPATGIPVGSRAESACKLVDSHHFVLKAPSGV